MDSVVHAVAKSRTQLSDFQCRSHLSSQSMIQAPFGQTSVMEHAISSTLRKHCLADRKSFMNLCWENKLLNNPMD